MAVMPEEVNMMGRKQIQGHVSPVDPGLLGGVTAQEGPARFIHLYIPRGEHHASHM